MRSAAKYTNVGRMFISQTNSTKARSPRSSRTVKFSPRSSSFSGEINLTN